MSEVSVVVPPAQFTQSESVATGSTSTIPTLATHGIEIPHGRQHQDVHVVVDVQHSAGTATTDIDLMGFNPSIGSSGMWVYLEENIFTTSGVARTHTASIALSQKMYVGRAFTRLAALVATDPGGTGNVVVTHIGFS